MPASLYKLACILIVVLPDPRLPKKMYVVSAAAACGWSARTGFLFELLLQEYLTDESLGGRNARIMSCHRETSSQQSYP